MIVRIVIEECMTRYDVRAESETGYAHDVRTIYKRNPEQEARKLAQDMASEHGLDGYEFSPLPTKQEVK